MFIKIEVRHAVKSGLEKEALETIRKLNKKGSDHAACTLWKELLQYGVPGATEDTFVRNNETDQTVILQSYLDEPGKIKLFLSA